MLLRNTLLVLGSLTLIAGIVLAILWLKLPSQPGQPQEDAQPAILVAATDIASGTLLRPDQVRWQKTETGAIGATDLVRGTASPTSYYGAVARNPLSAGQRLKDSDFVLAGARTFLAAALKPGTLAVSLSVDDAQSVSGLVQPGDIVDVVLTQSKNESDGDASAVGETLLRGVRVVATDQLFNQGPVKAAADSRFGVSQSKAPKEITLELSDIDAKRLLVATQLGRVSLVLHALEGPRGVSVPVMDEPVWGSDISAARGNRTRTHPIRLSAGTGRQTVQIIRGSKVEAQ
jgi:pilus assembly protein CpaB